MRNPLALYYDWAMTPPRVRHARFWLILPVGFSLALVSMLAWAARRGIVTDAAAILLLWEFALALSGVWLGYVGYRTLREAITAMRWLKREMGPSWRGGWRAAWRNLIGRSGKSG